MPEVPEQPTLTDGVVTLRRWRADDVDEAVAGHDDVIAHTKVIDVLKSLPRVGGVRAGRAMERLDIAANRRLRGLGKHQTAALLAEFSPPPRT